VDGEGDDGEERIGRKQPVFLVGCPGSMGAVVVMHHTAEGR
jgi:hypothetical protein